MTTTLLLAFLFLFVAAMTDLMRNKIHNWNTYTGMVVGLLAHYGERGWDGFQDSLAGLVACGAIMLVCFVLFEFGGGDLKLITMMGAFLGLHRGIEAMLWTFIVGSIMGIGLLIWQVGFGRLISKSIEHVKLVIQSRSWVPLNTDQRTLLQRRMFLGPAGFLATCIVVNRSLY